MSEMSAQELRKMLEEGWGIRLPGERSLYWNPRGRVPDGHIEVYITAQGKTTWWLRRATPEAIRYAREIREALKKRWEEEERHGAVLD
ncbi:hypothetical protein [Thermoflexus sp.]|uniref:hypothetical protein n=1 Tax=Thermoflexus sp. TaxID=1969742 RepID=UPI002ADE5C9B|nr:hypothetical protein [Thermoflexus sp.]